MPIGKKKKEKTACRKPLIFNSAVKYLSDTEQLAIDEFIIKQPRTDGWYKKGDKIFSFKGLEFPIGALTGFTRKGEINEDDLTFKYITPYATNRDTKAVRMIATNSNWEQSIWNGKKILAFIEDADFALETYTPKINPLVATQMRAYMKKAEAAEAEKAKTSLDEAEETKAKLAKAKEENAAMVKETEKQRQATIKKVETDAKKKKKN